MYRGELILDAAQTTHPWRGESVLNFSVNPTADFTVTYREVVPGQYPPEPESEPVDPTPTLPPMEDEEIAAGGASIGLLPLALALALVGAVLVRRRPRW